MADDPQKLKKIAAGAYDYDSDPRWADYWSNVLFPPHMASRPDVITHFKHKFYQRSIDPNFVVEPMPSSSQSTRTSSSSASSSSPANEQACRKNTASQTGTSTRTNAAPGQLRWDHRQSIQFSVNAWVFVVTLLAILPLVSQTLSNKAYRLALLGATISSGYSLYSLYGKPRAWNLQGVQLWFQSVVSTKDFIYLLYCLIFVSSQAHIKFSLMPVLCRVLEHVTKFLRRNFNHSTFYRYEAFMYWQLLRLMYHAPATAGYHQSGWAKLGRTVNPLVNRYAQFLRTPIAAAQRWWFRQ